MFRADPPGCACVLALQVTWVSRARADDKPSWVRSYGAKGANRSETSSLKDGLTLHRGLSHCIKLQHHERSILWHRKRGLYLRRLWHGEYTEAGRCDPLPRLWLQNIVQEANQ